MGRAQSRDQERGSSWEGAEECWGVWSDTREGQRLEAVLGDGRLPMPDRGERNGIPKKETNRHSLSWEGRGCEMRTALAGSPSASWGRLHEEKHGGLERTLSPDRLSLTSWHSGTWTVGVSLTRLCLSSLICKVRGESTFLKGFWRNE